MFVVTAFMRLFPLRPDKSGHYEQNVTTAYPSLFNTPLLSPNVSALAPICCIIQRYKIAQRRAVFVANVSSGLDSTTATSGQDDRQVIVVVPVTVTDAAAVNQHAVVQQRAVAFSDLLQSSQQIVEAINLKAIDLGDVLLFVLALAVVRKLVVAFADTNLGITAIAASIGEHER